MQYRDAVVRSVVDCPPVAIRAGRPIPNEDVAEEPGCLEKRGPSAFPTQGDHLCPPLRPCAKREHSRSKPCVYGRLTHLRAVHESIEHDHPNAISASADMRTAPHVRDMTRSFPCVCSNDHQTP